MKLFSALFLLSPSVTGSSVHSDGPKRNHDVTASERNLQNPDCPVLEGDISGNAELQQQFLEAIKPCGHYREAGCEYEVIPANVDFPGEGPGELQYDPYIVQFDIGVHLSISDTVLAANFPVDPIDCDHSWCQDEGETCLEIIVRGGSHVVGGGGCAGKCGGGCYLGTAGYAKDCMKHDVCSTYKALKTGLDIDDYDLGYCFDPDCGDEGAQALMNCFVDYWFGDEDVICDERMFAANEDVYGHWSRVSSVFGGPCYHFRDWASGQGIPNGGQIRNQYDYLVELADEGLDVSSDVSSEISD